MNDCNKFRTGAKNEFIFVKVASSAPEVVLGTNLMRCEIFFCTTKFLCGELKGLKISAFEELLTIFQK